MNVSLTPELEQFIQSQIESGKYASTDEVILAALRAFEERERIYKGRFDELRQEIMVGVEASERGEVVDGEIVFSQLQQKLQQLRDREGEWVIFAGLLFRLVEILKALSTMLLAIVIWVQWSAWEEKINQKCTTLAHFPNMGRRRDELLSSLRSFPVDDYLIFYRSIEGGIEILRVVSGYRDLEALFQDEDEG